MRVTLHESNEWMGEWMHEWMDGWMDGWMDECPIAHINGLICMACMHVDLYVCMHVDVRMHVYMGEWMIEWMDGWMSAQLPCHIMGWFAWHACIWMRTTECPLATLSIQQSAWHACMWAWAACICMHVDADEWMPSCHIIYRSSRVHGMHACGAWMACVCMHVGMDGMRVHACGHGWHACACMWTWMACIGMREGHGWMHASGHGCYACMFICACGCDARMRLYVP
jgi:hypothetical protein